MKLTIENLKAKRACVNGMAWITPIIETAPETVADRLCAEHPAWHQWAVYHGFNVHVNPAVWCRMGCVIVGGELRHIQTAGDRSTQTAGYGSTQTAGGWSTQTAGGWSTQTAGDGSTQTAGDRSTQTAGGWSTQTAGDRSRHKAGQGSVFICRHHNEERYVSAVALVDDLPDGPDYYWTYDINTKSWVHAADQSDPEKEGE